MPPKMFGPVWDIIYVGACAAGDVTRESCMFMTELLAPPAAPLHNSA